MFESWSLSRSAPSVYPTYPPGSFFKFPPQNLPPTLPAPVKDYSLSNPFTIPSNVYNRALHVSVPLTIAAVYAASVLTLNHINKNRGYKPWAFSKTFWWHAFVIAHNTFLAVYSAWTFVGMANAVRTSWPGWFGENGLAGVVDALCKIHGPRGLGDAATYSPSSSSWGLTNANLHLGEDGLVPDTTDVGRIWNEGLAFYGWLFYISKFYEVIDTTVILAKGKKSSLLQTYHHAGAMLCMWAGIRFMAPPIWMFVLVNSGIHALMYTYYTLTALGYRVPVAVKRLLTTMQIVQFVVGASFAAAHLFVAYDIPVLTAYTVTIENLSDALPSMASSVSSVLASATATGNAASYLKKFLLRAGGYEGAAERVPNAEGEPFGIDAVHAVEDAKSREEVRYRQDYQTIHCTDTSGQAFAIYLNVIYLIPLTCLFVQFFIRSYLKRFQATETKGRRPSRGQLAEKAGKDAWKGVGREVVNAVNEMHGSEVEGKQERSTASHDREGANSSSTADNGSEDVKERSGEEERSGSTASGNEGEPSTDKQSSDEAPVAANNSEEASDAVKNETSSASETEKDSAAYEANADDVMDEDEKKAEAEMQPNGSS